MIFDVVTNFYFLSVFVAWIVSCLIKMLIHFFYSGSFSFFAGFRNGGMPSSHSALMGSITFALFLEQGLSPVFFLAFVLATLILRDAVTVRREVGVLGDSVNVLLKKQKINSLKVVYGHTFFQVLVGLFIGVISTGFFFLVLLI